jgi:probable HAF family extracellular repeat protein
MIRPTTLRAVAGATVALALAVVPHAAGAATADVTGLQPGSGSVRYVEHPLSFDARITDVNDLGLVVGESSGHAFSWSARTRHLTDLGGVRSVANGVNDLGQVVGSSEFGFIRHAVLWNRGSQQPVDLGTLGGSSSTAWAINNLGVVVGDSDTADGTSHAFRWDPRSRRMTDLGTLGGDSSSATAINDLGQVVGWARTGQFLAHAFRWDPWSRHMRDLGLPPNSVVAFATGINNRGEIVGYSGNVGDFTDRTFRWDPRTSRMATLAGVPDVYSHATGINDLGQVVGFWDDQSGRATPFVWSPVRRSPVALPTQPAEPYSTYATASAINNRSWVAGADGSAVLWLPAHGH